MELRRPQQQILLIFLVVFGLFGQSRAKETPDLRTTAGMWKVEIRVWSLPGPDERVVSLNQSGVLTIDRTSLPFTSSGPMKTSYKGTLSVESAEKIRGLCEAALRTLDFKTAQSRVADGINVSITLETGTVMLLARCHGLRELADAGRPIARLVARINTKLPDGWKLE